MPSTISLASTSCPRCSRRPERVISTSSRNCPVTSGPRVVPASAGPRPRVTGNGVARSGTNKWQCKAVLHAAGVTCPPASLSFRPDRRADALPHGRYFVKPAYCDASEGIDGDWSSTGPGATCRGRARIHERFAQPAIVEQFIAERELNVSVLQKAKPSRSWPSLKSISAPSKPAGHASSTTPRSGMRIRLPSTIHRG